MNSNTVLVIFLVALFVVLGVVTVPIIKAKAYRYLLAIVFGVIILILVAVSTYNRTLYIDDFVPFGTNDIEQTNQVMDTAIETQGEDLNTILSNDGLKNSIPISSFNIHFRDGVFANLQFSLMLPQNVGTLEKSIQVNYEGQIFTSETVYFPDNSLLSQTIPVYDLKHIVSTIASSDIFQQFDLSNANFMFIGYREISANTNLPSNSYMVDADRLFQMQSIESPGKYYVFNVIAGDKYFQILSLQENA